MREPRCKTCKHPKVKEIDQLLVEGKLSMRDIAKRYGRTASSIQRHSKTHIPKVVSQSQKAKNIAHADDLVSKFDTVENELWTVVNELGIERDFKGVIRGLSELRKTFESRIKLSEKLSDEGKKDRLYDVEWNLMVSKILRVIEQFPEAWYALRKTLGDEDELAEEPSPSN